jgi:hypothetical protein
MTHLGQSVDRRHRRRFVRRLPSRALSRTGTGATIRGVANKWAKVPPSPALAEMMRADREREQAEPLGGWRGEVATPGRTDPPPPAPQPLVIPPADWAEEELRRADEEHQA